MGQYLTKRDGRWHFVRRVPDELAQLDHRGIVRQSTKIRVAEDRAGVRAQRIADQFNVALEAYWRGLLDGQSAEAQIRFEEARRRARSMRFDYATVPELTMRPSEDLRDRLEHLVAKRKVDDEPTVTALLGGEPRPELRITGLFQRFEELMKGSLADLSQDQLRKWRNPKKRAIANLIEAIGDKPLRRITRNDALDFREWWQERIVEGEVEIGTANKDIGHLNKMLRTVNMADRLGLEPIFAELRIEGGKEGSRLPYPIEFVRDRLLAQGAMDALNEEARTIVYLITETGLRPSEAANLNETTIFLDGKIPYVSVRPDGRRMKTDQSERDIPLVGVALTAMQAFPKGFPRYRDKSASLSALVNKVLGNASLRPAGQTLYSLRHTFEDRLTAVEAPEKVIASLMGHKWQRPKYGAGPSLQQKQEWLERIAFNVK